MSMFIYYLGAGMKRIFLVVLLMIISSASYAETMEGYGKSKWGMTPQQVVMAESGKAHLLENPIKYKGKLGLVAIDSVEIGSSSYEVNYLFDGSDKLVQVNVSAKEEKNHLINEDNFKSAESLLTQKYGTPKYRDEGVKLIWNPKGTTIELSHFYIEKVVTKVTIRYLPEETTKIETSNI